MLCNNYNYIAITVLHNNYNAVKVKFNHMHVNIDCYNYIMISYTS